MKDTTMLKPTIEAHAPEIHMTSNYTLFKGIIGNRSIYEPHLRRLEVSIQKRNLLMYNPILVNEKMEVIDGQHRLMAAKNLSIPIYYIVVPQTGLSEIQQLNVNIRAWSLEDYLESYVARGLRDYILLQNFTEEYRLSIPIAIIVMTDEYEFPTKQKEKFKSGNFTIKNLQLAQNMGSLISEIRWYSPDYAWTDRDLMLALKQVIEKTDPKDLIKKLHDYGLVITRRESKKDYLLELEQILSYNSTNSVQLR